MLHVKAATMAGTKNDRGNEDRFSIHRGKELSVAVFDGHGGPDCAEAFSALYKEKGGGWMGETLCSLNKDFLSAAKTRRDNSGSTGVSCTFFEKEGKIRSWNIGDSEAMKVGIKDGKVYYEMLSKSHAVGKLNAAEVRKIESGQEIKPES